MALILHRIHSLVFMFFLNHVFDLAPFPQKNPTYLRGLQVHLTLYDG